MSDIAIIGMGARFAGAEDLHAYWDLNRSGRDAFGPVPEDRWPAEAFYDTSRRATDKTYAPAGAFLDDIRRFPALLLGIPPRRVEVMDPQQRLSIVLSLHALLDAGYGPRAMPRRTGVFVGVTANEFRQVLGSRVVAQLMATGALGTPPDDAESLARAIENVVPSRPFTAPGALSNMVAAAVAQELDLHGPAYTVDAACASALVAVHDAVSQLRAGQIDAAIAGGVYLQVSPEHYIAFARIGAMSASGYCRPFDHRADGFVQGDGGGMVVLKRLDDAVRDGDRVVAVIRGVALNNDGRGDGPMAPIQAGQTEVIVDAWTDSGLDPADVRYLEAHGTGTGVGDLTEINGLRAAIGTPSGPVTLGSSKANIGHTMSAAGIAGLIRAVQAIEHGVLPPMAGFESPKEELELDGSTLRVPTEASPWQADRRIAGVSSFGFGGTNGHVVLTNFERPTSAPPLPAPVDQVELVRLGAADDGALRDTARRLAAELRARPSLSVATVARTWAVRPGLPSRLALAVRSRDELLDALDEVADGGFPKGAAMGTFDGNAPRLALLFPGQGAQRVGMLAGIRDRFPTVAATLAELEADLEDLLDVPLTDLLYPDGVDADEAAARLTHTAHCQPVMVAAGVALARLLNELGVEASIATGHSLGEFNAAAVGGVMSERDAVRFAARRGRAMADVDGDPGTMAALLTDRETAAGLLVEGAVLANLNHPSQVVISGTTDAVAAVVEAAQAAGVEARPLEVSHAFHSPVFADLDLRAEVAALDLSEPTGRVASGIAGRPYGSADEARTVFERHARSPVDFEGALEQCLDEGADLFLQVGAGGPLASFARKVVGDRARAVLTLASLDDDDGGLSLLQTLGWLWVHGVDLDTEPVTADAPLASLPPAVLPTESYWPVKDKAQKALKLAGVGVATATATPSEAPAAPEAPGTDDEVFDKVAAVIARVSSYPVAALKGSSTLVDDLGFDSLMVSDLATGLADAFPGLGGLPQELWLNQPTVGDIVEHVRTGGVGTDTSADDDAPLDAFRLVWRPTGLPEGRPADGALHGVTIAMTGARDNDIKAALRQAGAEVTRRPRGPVDQIVHVCPFTDPVPPHAVLAGEAEVVDRSGPLIATLDAQAEHGGTPGLLVVRRDDDLWAEAESAVARTVSREHPDGVSKAVRFVDVAPAFRAARIVQELVSEDRSADVRWTAAGREVLGHEPALAVDAPLTLGADDTVLITGGTRGIGAALAAKLSEAGTRCLLVGRSDPSDEAKSLLSDRVVHVRADVTDREALLEAVASHRPITAVVHAAGILADGPLGQVDPERGARARAVKVSGWMNSLAAAGSDLTVALSIGSWAGRYGNRHQVHYSAANALMSSLAEHAPAGVRTVCGEFGPWTSSAMVSSIPAPIQAAMRAEGVDFVGDEVGLQALLDDLGHRRGTVVHGRGLPWTTRARVHVETLDTETHPYLLDHAIEGTPVLPLAGAADLVAHVAAVAPPFEVVDLQLFQGITVAEPERVEVSVRGDRAEVRKGADRALAYRARVRPAALPDVPTRLEDGEAPGLSLRSFYDEVTFHGPLLAGVSAIDGVGDDFVRARVRTGTPREWIPESSRAGWAVDPLALDSAFQATALVAWERYHRAGTPVSLGRFVQVHPFPAGTLRVDVRFDEVTSDRVSGSFWFFTEDGTLLAVAEDAVADLRQVDEEEALPDHFDPKAEWIDPSAWSELRDLDMRLEAATAIGIRNPYFHVHQGTARNTTVVEGRELVNYSSYNYLGLSGDPRVLEQVTEAVHRYGTSVSASRVASGERPFHHELEAELAAAQGLDDTLVFTAGHMTNVNVIGHLMGPNDLVLHDEFIHDSALQGIKLSGAGRRGYRHEDPEHLAQLLAELRPHHEKCLIIVEGVYSMDGDICELPAYLELKKKWGCLLMVDEAHSFGVVGATGCGVGEHFGDRLDPAEIDLWMGTLSKSLASCGGWIGGSAAMIRYLRYTAPGFVYSAGITPANAVAALASLRLMLAEPERVQKLQANAQLFHDALDERGVDTGPAVGGSGVIPAITGNSMHALHLSQRLQDQGINVQPIVYPAVPDDASRLRFFLSSTHTSEQLVDTAEKVASTLAKIREDMPVG